MDLSKKEVEETQIRVFFFETTEEISILQNKCEIKEFVCNVCAKTRKNESPRQKV
jgi:hypothetical protein